MAMSHRVVFTPSGLDGTRRRRAPPCSTRRASSASTSTRCAVGAASAAGARSCPAVGSFAKWGIDATHRRAQPAGETRASTTTATARCSPAVASVAAAHIVGDVVIDVPGRRARCTARSCARTSTSRRLVVDPMFTLPTSSVDRRPSSGRCRAVPAELVTAAVETQHGVGRDVRRADASSVLVRCTLPIAQRRPRRHASRSGQPMAAATCRRVWPGYVDTVFGIAVDIGSTTIAGHLCDLATGEVLASGRADEPADPLRRGPDEPGVVRDDEPGRRARAHRRRAGRARRAGRRAASTAPASTAEHVLEIVLVGNPIMHHIALGIDPTPLGAAPFVLATDEAVVVPARRSRPRPAVRRVLRRRRASPATSAPTPPRRCSSEGPHRVDDDAAARRRRHQRRDRARRPHAPVRRVEPDRTGVRGRADQLRAARHGGRHRAGAHRPRVTLEPRFKVIGCDLWSDDPGFAAATATLGHQRRLRLGHHRGRSPRCSWPA